MNNNKPIDNVEKLVIEEFRLEIELNELTNETQNIEKKQEIRTKLTDIRRKIAQTRNSRPSENYLINPWELEINSPKMVLHSPTLTTTNTTATTTTTNTTTTVPTSQIQASSDSFTFPLGNIAPSNQDNRIKLLEEENRRLLEHIDKRAERRLTVSNLFQPRNKMRNSLLDLKPPKSSIQPPFTFSNTALNLQTQQEDNLPDMRTKQDCRESFLHRLKLIPTFSGKNKKELTDFIDICDAICNFCESDDEYNEFLFQIMLQLRSEARSIIGDKTAWIEIRQTLLSYFSYLSNREINNSKIENLRQQKDETLLTYSERTRDLLAEKNSSYDNISFEQKQEYDRAVRKSFAKGISESRPREKMLLRGASSLEDSIALALEMENEMTTDIRRNEFFCNYCKSSGHRARDCRRKEQNNSQIGQLISAFRSVGMGKQNGNGNYQNNFSRSNQNYSPNNFQRGFSNYNRFNNNSGYGYNNGRYYNGNNQGNNRFYSGNNQFNTRNNRYNPGNNQYNPGNNQFSSGNNQYGNNRPNNNPNDRSNGNNFRPNPNRNSFPSNAGNRQPKNPFESEN